jgi:hypothetical protein
VVLSWKATPKGSSARRRDRQGCAQQLACAAANSWCRGRTREGRGLGLKQVRGIMVMGGPFKRARDAHGLELEGNTPRGHQPEGEIAKGVLNSWLVQRPIAGVVAGRVKDVVLSWKATPKGSSARRRDRQGCAKQLACAAANSWCRGRTREGRGLGLKQVHGIMVMGGPFKPARGHGLDAGRQHPAEGSSARRRDRQGLPKQLACAAADSWCRGRTREGHGLELEGKPLSSPSPKARTSQVCPTAGSCLRTGRACAAADS